MPTVAVSAPAPGEGNWAGAPSAVLDDGGGVVLAYRARSPDQRGSATVIARGDGEDMTTVARLDKERFGAASLERPALVRTVSGRWRLYVSCATPDSKHWRIDVLEADDPAALQDADARVAFPGDERTAVKDPVVRRTVAGWQAWICCHPLDVPGEEDRMYTRHAVSADGLEWEWRGIALTGRASAWDARGTRVTAVLADGRAAYDGRASKRENFRERTGLAVCTPEDGVLVGQGDAPVSEARYLDVVPLPDGGYRLYYEAPLADGSHELRTELVTRCG
ncbi:MAG: hypothetical protein ACXVSX_13875 [Solirubrobacteraceae bacterium]